MATTLVYVVSDFTPFTKIVSADVNSRFSDIKSRLNWAGGTSATTGLGDDNIQSNTASGGGLTRSSKLKSGTANYVLINDASGNVTEEATLAYSRGGLAMAVVPASQQPGDVLQINSAKTALVLSQPTAVPASLKLFQFYYLS